MHYDVCCQWYYDSKATILSSSLIFNRRRRNESMGAEEIERMWSMLQPLRIREVRVINKERCGEAAAVEAGV